jgi:integrase
MDIAVESGMRQGEIHRLRWSDVDEQRGVIHLYRKDKKAEGGRSKQKIPLLKGVREVLLRARNESEQGDNLFKVQRAASISDRFARLTAKVGIDDLRFHDLRHEAISRMFERGMKVEQVRVVSGHRSLDQLSRYINLRPEDLADH